MSDSDLSNLWSTLQRVWRRWRQSDERTEEDETLSSTSTGEPLPRVVMRDGVMSIDTALRHVPRLLLLEPYDGNARPLLTDLYSQLTRRPRPWIAPLTSLLPRGGDTSQAPDPVDVLVLLNIQGAKKSPAAAQAILDKGLVVWVVDEADTLSDSGQAWLANCLDRYDKSSCLAVARQAPGGTAWRDFSVAYVAAPSWSTIERWLHQQNNGSPLALRRLARHSEARSAAQASPIFRQTLVKASSRRSRFAELYSIWLDMLLERPDATLLASAIQLAWETQTGGPISPPDGLLGRLVYEAQPKHWQFCHPALQHRLASLARQVSRAELEPRVNDPAWHEVIALWAATSPEAAGWMTDLLRTPTDVYLRLVLRMAQEMQPRGAELEAQALVVALRGLRDELQRLAGRSDEMRSTYTSPLVEALGDHQGMTQTLDASHVLRALARHNATAVRYAAVQALVELRDEVSLEELSIRLAEAYVAISSPSIGAPQGATASSNVRPPECVPLSEARVRVTLARTAARGLVGAGQLGLQRLQRSLNDPRSAVRKLAARALSDMGEDGLTVLRDSLINGETGARNAAALGLGNMGEAGVGVLVRILSIGQPNAQDAAERTLVQLGHRDPATLLTYLGRTQPLRAYPLRSERIVRIYRMVGLRAVPALLQTIRQSDSPASELAAQVIDELDLFSSEVAEVLVHALHDDRQAVRLRCKSMLQRHGHAAVPVMLQAVTRQPDRLTEVLDLIANLPELVIDEPLVTGLGELMLKAASKERMNIVKLLSRAPVSISAPSLVQAITDQDAGVAQAALEVFNRDAGGLDEAVADALVSVLSTARPHERVVLIRLLGQASGAVVTTALIAALQDATPEVRLAAAQALGRRREVEAVKALESTLKSETNTTTRAALIDALGGVAIEAAVPFAIEAVGSTQETLRKAAYALLRQAGPLSVTPLVEVACRTDNRQLRTHIVNLLGDMATEDRPGADHAYAIARVWHTLFSRPCTVEQAYELAEMLRGWPYARETLRCYETAAVYGGYTHLRELEDVRRHLHWVKTIDTWLQPEIKWFLTQLESIAVRALASYDALRADDLQHSVDALDDLAHALDETRFDWQPFRDIIERWRELIWQVGGDLSGPPDLALETITPEVRLHDDHMPVTVAIRLTNKGSSDARAIEVELNRDQVEGNAKESEEESRLRLTGAIQWKLPVLQPNGETRWEFQVRLQKATNVTFPFLVSFEDARRRYVKALALVVRFKTPRQIYIPLRANPYHVSGPIKAGEMFYGRNDELGWLANNLEGRHTNNDIILFGDRRVGKTSLLYQLRQRTRLASEDYLFPLIDLQGVISEMRPGEFYYTLARTLRDALQPWPVQLRPIDRRQFASNPSERFSDYLAEVLKAMGERKLILMLDEFDYLLAGVRGKTIEDTFPDRLRHWMQHLDKISFIIVGAHGLREDAERREVLPAGHGISRIIRFLTFKDAEDLIQTPVQGEVEFDRHIIERILDVTHGHPYFVQYVCHSLYERLRMLRRNYVELPDISFVLRDVVELHEVSGTIKNNYIDLSQEQMTVLAALALVANGRQPYASPADVGYQLQTYDIELSDGELMQTLKELEERDYLIPDPSQTGRVGFAAELVRIWVANRAAEELKRLSTTGRDHATSA